MSVKVEKNFLMRKFANIKKTRKFIKSDLIEYREKQYEVEFLQLMKKGYEDMAQINLELSQLPFECENANINEYENWLCGV